MRTVLEMDTILHHIPKLEVIHLGTQFMGGVSARAVKALLTIVITHVLPEEDARSGVIAFKS